jgi:cytochrome bd-type quinol oxidase subunit 2
MILARGGSTATKVIRWIARILSIPPVVFYVLFSVGHLVGGEEGTGHIETRDLICLILLVAFTSIMSVMLIISWKWEGIGGIVTALCGIILFAVLAIGVKRNGPHIATIVNVPFLLPGLLFLYTWFRARKEKQ